MFTNGRFVYIRLQCRFAKAARAWYDSFALNAFGCVVRSLCEVI
jgi:hypothetical protein